MCALDDIRLCRSSTQSSPPQGGHSLRVSHEEAPVSPAPANFLLAILWQGLRFTVLPLLKAAAIRVRKALFEPGRAPDFVHFLTGVLASIVTDMKGSEAAKVDILSDKGIPESLHFICSVRRSRPPKLTASCRSQAQAREFNSGTSRRFLAGQSSAECRPSFRSIPEPRAWRDRRL